MSAVGKLHLDGYRSRLGRSKNDEAFPIHPTATRAGGIDRHHQPIWSTRIVIGMPQPKFEGFECRKDSYFQFIANATR